MKNKFLLVILSIFLILSVILNFISFTKIDIKKEKTPISITETISHCDDKRFEGLMRYYKEIIDVKEDTFTDHLGNIYPNSILVVPKGYLKSEMVFIREAKETGSMVPTMFGEHRRLAIKYRGQIPLDKGDIVQFYSELYNKNVIHRINETITNSSGTFISTLGDNNVENDGWSPIENVKYLIVGVIY